MDTTNATVTAPTATTPANRRLIDTTGFFAILNKRKTIKADHIGSQIVLAVQGNGQFLAKGFTYDGPKGATENMFDRWIYNLQANSAYSMQRPENKAILVEAMKAEAAGDLEAATDLFNDFLNAIQVSFSVIVNPGSSPRKFESGDQVKATVEEVTNGAGVKQLVVNDVRYKAPVAVEATKFTVEDLLGDLVK
jgi:hypothetical protein